MNEIIVDPVLPTKANTLSNCVTIIEAAQVNNNIDIVKIVCLVFDGGCFMISSSSLSSSCKANAFSFSDFVLITLSSELRHGCTCNGYENRTRITIANLPNEMNIDVSDVV